METIRKRAITPETDEYYYVEMPTHKVIRVTILELNFPQDGLRILDAKEILTSHFNLSKEQKQAKVKSGGRYIDLFYYEMVAPAFQNLSKKGELIQPGGKNTPYFKSNTPPIPSETILIPPTIKDIYQKERRELAAQLLEEIKNNEPEFFEKLVIDLLVRMGYGGSREDAGKAVGGSNDGGIDGIINEDRLGLDMVYIQAKQWEGSVSRPEIQKFAGALQGQRARKGIFITTSEFSKGCREFVKTIDSKIVLIDGQQLAEYMIEYNLGVSIVDTYEIKRVDSDYFSEDE